MTDDDLMTPPEVAERLRVSTETLELWRGKRQGPAWIKLGDGKKAPVRYRRSVIETYLTERETRHDQA